MVLKEAIFNEVIKFNSELSNESIASLVLFNLSKNKHFKDIYQHFNLIKNKNGEIRIFSSYLNDLQGMIKKKLDVLVINPNYNDIEDSFFDEMNNDHFFEEAETVFDDILFIPDEKYQNIINFFSILEESYSFYDVVKKLKSSNSMILLDVSQNVIHHSINEKRNGIKPFFNILTDLYTHSICSGFFKIKNDKIKFTSNNCIEYFGSNELQYLSMINNKEDIISYINEIGFSSIKTFFVDEETNEVPEEIVSLLQDPSIDNWNVAQNYNNKGSKYTNLLLEIVTSEKTTDEKHFDIANHFFNLLKEQAINYKEKLFNNLRPISELEQPTELINSITEKVITYFPSLKEVNKDNKDNKENITTKHYYSKSNVCSTNEQFKDLCDKNNLKFYDNEEIDNLIKGFQYIKNDFFNNFENKKNFTISISSKDELLGYGHFFIEKNVIRINTVNISINHRGKKLIAKIYQEIINYSKEKNLPIKTTMYNNISENILPKIKRKLLQEHKDDFIRFVLVYTKYYEKELKEWSKLYDKIYSQN
jgi:hypothetical protein